LDISELNRISSQKEFRRHPWELARVRAISFLLKKSFPKYKRILDIGSGDAFVIRQLADKNIADVYTAIDTAYSPQIISTLKENADAGIEFYSGLPENINADCILILDVLEHCENDHEVLQDNTRKGAIAEGATVLVTVPAFGGLFSQHDRLLGHHRRYSRKQLKRLLEKNEMQVINDGYFFMSLLPVRIIQLLFEKLNLRKAKKSIDDWKGNNIISNIISTILWADFRVCYFLSRLGINLPGLSCYCLCKKSPS